MIFLFLLKSLIPKIADRKNEFTFSFHPKAKPKGLRMSLADDQRFFGANAPQNDMWRTQDDM